MNKRTKLAIGGVAAAAAIAIGAGVVSAAGGDDDVPLEGSDYDRATEAALEHVGEGSVTETELGDDGAAYEVEVLREDGTQVEVELDENFEVIGSEPDDDGAGDDDGDDEDEAGEDDD